MFGIYSHQGLKENILIFHLMGDSWALIFFARIHAKLCHVIKICLLVPFFFRAVKLKKNRHKNSIDNQYKGTAADEKKLLCA